MNSKDLKLLSIFEALQNVEKDYGKITFWSFICAFLLIAAGIYFIFSVIKAKYELKEKERASFNRKTFNKAKMNYKRHKIKNKVEKS